MNDPRSGWPISLTLEALEDRWSLIVIRDLMFGKRRHFRELADSVGGADSLQHSGRPADTLGESRWSAAGSANLVNEALLRLALSPRRQGSPAPPACE